MDKEFLLTWIYDFLSELGSKLIYIGKRGPRGSLDDIYNSKWQETIVPFY